MGKKQINYKQNNYKQNYKFIDSLVLNNETYIDFLERFKKVALSVFEWVNLPDSMNAMYLERCLYFYGQASLLKDKNYGFINTKCNSNGSINIYRLPTNLNCYSYEYNTSRKLYSGLIEGLNNEEKENFQYNSCILVQNDWERIPTAQTMELFAWRLYEAQRTADINIHGQKFPLVIITDEKQRLTLENMYNEYNGNRFIIFGDKNNLTGNEIRAIKTDVPYVADKLMEYKKEIWNEALTFLGINNIMIDKKERLITDEANSNNELINLNLQSHLAPRQYACKQFNDLFGFTGTDKEISVRVRSDLHNIIKNAQSVVNDFKALNEIDTFEGGGDIG